MARNTEPIHRGGDRTVHIDGLDAVGHREYRHHDGATALHARDHTLRDIGRRQRAARYRERVRGSSRTMLAEGIPVLRRGSRALHAEPATATTLTEARSSDARAARTSPTSGSAAATTMRSGSATAPSSARTMRTRGDPASQRKKRGRRIVRDRNRQRDNAESSTDSVALYRVECGDQPAAVDLLQADLDAARGERAVGVLLAGGDLVDEHQDRRRSPDASRTPRPARLTRRS